MYKHGISFLEMMTSL